MNSPALKYCFDIRAAMRIQGAVRAYLARLPTLKASIEREFRELMELHQEDDGQTPFHQAWLRDFDLETIRSYSEQTVLPSGFYPGNTILAIEDGTP
jgi:hypothetical protein